MTLAAGELRAILAILAVLLVRLGNTHPLTRRVQACMATPNPKETPDE